MFHPIALKEYRFFDLLNCDGGCIGGAEIINQDLNVEERKNKINDYKKNMNNTKGLVCDVEDIFNNVNFSRKF